MSRKLTFATRAEAQQEIDTMRGWDAVPVEIRVTDPETYLPARAWAIEVRGYGDPQYLRENGYVE